MGWFLHNGLDVEHYASPKCFNVQTLCKMHLTNCLLEYKILQKSCLVVWFSLHVSYYIHIIYSYYNVQYPHNQNNYLTIYKSKLLFYNILYTSITYIHTYIQHSRLNDLNWSNYMSSILLKRYYIIQYTHLNCYYMQYTHNSIIYNAQIWI